LHFFIIDNNIIVFLCIDDLKSLVPVPSEIFDYRKLFEN